MLALASLLFASAQATPTAWHHVLIRHENYDDFEPGSGHLARFGAPYPLTLTPRRWSLWLPDVPLFDAGRDEDWDTEDGIARYESPVIVVADGFEELWLSWNIDHRASTGVSIELRVGRARDDSWSPWLHVASFGACEVPFARSVVFSGNVTQPVFDALPTQAFEDGAIQLDHFVSDQLWDRAQYAVRARTLSDSAEVRVRSMVVCASRHAVPGDEPDLAAPRAVSVHRAIASIGYYGPIAESIGNTSALEEGAALLCSTGSIVKYREGAGTAKMLELLRATRIDWVNTIWPTVVVQVAHELGVPGYVARFSSWHDVADTIANDQPLVIRVEDAHGGAATWWVLRGFDEHGDALVIDPLAVAQAERTVPRYELTHNWLARGGLTCVFLPRGEK